MLSNRSTRLSAAASERAIIDIGSNTVRLVVFDGPLRAPTVVLNEKVTAKLGKGVNETGELAPKAQKYALAALDRFALLLRARGVRDVETVATAATRDATNGPSFLAAIKRLGLSPRVLGGEDEALAGAQGVIGAFPDAKGVVADLGGGSLELIHVAEGKGDHGTSLPFGSLHLAALVESGPEAFRKVLRKAIASSQFECAANETLFLVGGSNRALARYAIQNTAWPLDDPHGFSLDRASAQAICVSLRDEQTPIEVSGVPAWRKASLPSTAALLSELIRDIRPERVIFSSWGLREGLLYARLGHDIRNQSPLIAGVADFVERQGISAAFAAIVAGWTTDASMPDGTNNEDLRLAAVMLSLASQRLEPNLRMRHAVDWALRKRWVGVSAQGRAMMAACMLAHGGGDPMQAELMTLASPEALARAAAWGSAIRLCRRLGGGSAQPLTQSALRADGPALVLSIDPALVGLISDGVEKDLRTLADRLKLEPRVALAE